MSIVSEKISAISLAASKGIDAFALNVGGDSWQPDQVAAAFTAAKSGDFKLFLSFDMTSIACSSPGDAKLLQDYINTYTTHPSYMKYRDRPLVSTFSGENCRFGKSGIDEAWTYALNGTSPIHFVPSFFVDPASFPGLSVMDGSFNVMFILFYYILHPLKFVSGTRLGQWAIIQSVTTPIMHTSRILEVARIWLEFPLGFLP